jgi:hypothetical protein
MTAEERKGQTIILSFIALILLISLGVITMYVSARGTERLPAQIVRFVLTAALSFGVYQGSVTAKWILVVLMMLGGAMGLGAAFGGNPAALVFGVGLAAVYLSFAIVLIASPSVNAFLSYQRGVRAV